MKSIPATLDFVADLLSKRKDEGKRPVLYLPGNAGRIAPVEEWIFANADKLSGVDVFQALALGPRSGWEKAVMGGVGIVTPFIGPGVRDLVNKGLARNIRCNLSQVSRLFSSRWKPTVAFAHTSMPDMFGRVTLGLNAGLDVSPLYSAELKIAIVNKRMPRFHIRSYYDQPTGRHVQAGCDMFLSEFDFVVEVDEPLLEHSMTPVSEENASDTEGIAKNILDLLSNSSSGDLPHTLQLGIGRIPNTVARSLATKGRSVQAIWSELISDGTLNLYKQGLIRRTNGFFLREHIVTGIILGTQELYDELHDNPHFAVLPQDIVNDPAMIKHNKHMASINSAIAVSISGEVAAATIKKQYYSDVGGQFDFALGASWAEDGIAVIALPSIARLSDGSLESKIVATHTEGAHHTIGADLPVVVVTEQGIADLRGLNDHERVETMLSVAHPDWQKSLAKEARLLPSMQGVGVISARLILLTDGRIAHLRPATRGDIPAIKEYITRLSDNDRRTRYMGTVNVGALTTEARLERIYHDTLDYLIHAAFIMELDGEIIGIAHAFQLEEKGTYEVSFSRRSDLHGQGIGRSLMRIIIDWGIATKAKRFEAITYRSENPRMRALFDRFGFTHHPFPDDYEVVCYTAELDKFAEKA